MDLLSRKEANNLVSLGGDDDMAQFLVGFLSAALWTCGDMGLGNQNDSHDTPMDENYSIIDIDDKNQIEMAELIRPFFEANQESWNEFDYPDGRAGYDLMLTMAGHGVGFWDRDELKEGAIGDLLTTKVNEMFGYAEPYMYGDGETAFIEVV